MASGTSSALQRATMILATPITNFPKPETSTGSRPSQIQLLTWDDLHSTLSGVPAILAPLVPPDPDS